MVGAVVARNINILQTVIIKIAMANVERPAVHLSQAGFFSDILKGAFPGVAPECDPAAVRGIVQIVGQHVGVLQIQQVHRLEIIGEDQVKITVIVIIHSDHSDGVGELVEPGRRGNVFESAVAFIVVKNGGAEARHQQIELAVIVIVEPQRV